MPQPFENLLESYRDVLAKIDSDAAALNMRLQSLELEVKRTKSRLADLHKNRDHIVNAERICRELLAAPSQLEALSQHNLFVDRADLDEPSIPLDDKLARARIGTQRFLMLNELATQGTLTILDIVSQTGLPQKRVRDQMIVDLDRGIVEKVEPSEALRLTAAGRDLLERYKSYRREKQLPLPTREDGLSDVAAEEASPSSHTVLEGL